MTSQVRPIRSPNSVRRASGKTVQPKRQTEGIDPSTAPEEAEPCWSSTPLRVAVLAPTLPHRKQIAAEIRRLGHLPAPVAAIQDLETMAEAQPGRFDKLVLVLNGDGLDQEQRLNRAIAALGTPNTLVYTKTPVAIVRRWVEPAATPKLLIAKQPIQGAQLVKQLSSIGVFPRRFGEGRLASFGKIVFSEPEGVVRIGPRTLCLKRTEFDLALLLLRNAMRVVSFDTISRSVWHEPSVLTNEPTAQLIGRIRLWLTPDVTGYAIHELPGIGYVVIDALSLPHAKLEDMVA